MQSVRPLIGLCGISAALGLCAGQLATDLGAHPPEVSGVGAPPGSQVCVASWGFSCVPQSANLGVRNLDSGERWGWLSQFTVQGLRGVGRQRLWLQGRVL